MSIQVENKLKNCEDKSVFEQEAHFMPCKIEEDGPAEVRKYFKPYIKEDGSEGLTSTFRGHPLDGTELSLPAGYRAVLVTEAKRPLAEQADRRFQVAGGFKQFTHWNWDKKPSKNDDVVKALDWADLAEAIHGD
ncbi:ribonuclease H2 subunit C [Pectinophora gossypiella]|uniref:ribonuclease H2 subunit C n=1 Tax=Pectinophora gossypiella TaxID=13191 RepID=UPI00214E996D|nr:ribonuclease H2 subunit C [Pectinophora gossypiella]